MYNQTLKNYNKPQSSHFPQSFISSITLPTEIDSLYDMRRQLNADFQLQMRDYREFSELQRLENERQKEEEKKAQEANHKREW